MKKVKYREFDSAKYLKSELAVTEYLKAILEENEPSILPYALGQIARAQGMTKLAKKTGISRESLYKSLSQKGNPTFDTVSKILKAYGIKLIVKEEKPQKAA
jgi:probable addiction module antidote protein